jgi:DNA gyrase subunit A
LLSITEKGYGKRSYARDYRKTHRGSHGVIAMKISKRNGKLVKVLDVTDVGEILVTSKEGMVIRVPVEEISIHGRATMGVRIMRLNEGDVVVDVEPLAE